MDRRTARDRMLRGMVGTVALCIAATSVAIVPAVSAASPTACLVTNTATGARTRKLQAALDAALPGQRLTLRGTCVGPVEIRTPLTLTGARSARSGPPTVDGAGVTDVPVVRLSAGTGTIRLTGLRIRNGGARLISDGRDTKSVLTSVRLSGGTSTTTGGAIIVGGTMTITGASRITGNTAHRKGGGIMQAGGSLTITGTTIISGNSVPTIEYPAYDGGGGIYAYDGSLTIGGSVSIRENTSAGLGGGVMVLTHVFRLQDGATITANQAASAGGGFHGTLSDIKGVSCGVNVTGNLAPSAANCYPAEPNTP